MSFWRYATPEATAGGAAPSASSTRRHRRERALDQVAHLRVFDVSGHRDEQLRRHVDAAEVVAQPGLVERRHRGRRPQNRPPERMLRPELLREDLVHQIVRRVLDHLDLFEDDVLLAEDVGRRKRGPQHHVPQQIGRERQVLVEHLDVVAGVFLGRERVELAADRIDLLRDLLRRSARRALEQHVLDEMRDAALGVAFVARAAHQPHADRHRSHVRHRLGDEPQSGRQGFRYDHGQPLRAASTPGTGR